VLVSMEEMLKEARANRYAVGYFESWNLESMRAVIEAGEEQRRPVIVGFNGGFLAARKREMEYYAALGKKAVEKASVPTLLLLNEALDLQQIVDGLRLGFTSVMIDSSSLQFNENVRFTKRVVKVAHSAGACVEAQLDTLPHAKEGVLAQEAKEASMTDPKRAAVFVRETNVDALSVSVGNVHALYRGKARIDLDRIKEIRELVDVPLVMHGATGIPDESIKRAIQAGICKVNLGMALRRAFADGIRKALGRSSTIDPESILDSAEREMKRLVKDKIEVYSRSRRRT
jgi:fructose-bisphosphate aldolase class II